MGRSPSPERRDRGIDADRRSHKEDRKRRKSDKERRKKDKRDRTRSRSRSPSRSRSRSRERKRRRSSQPPVADELAAARQAALAGLDEEGQRKAAREREQAVLDEEMEKRRKRIEAWQQQRRKLQEDTASSAATEAAAATAAAAEQEAAANEGREWNLEDEHGLSDGESEGGSGADGDAEAGGSAAAATDTATAPAPAVAGPTAEALPAPPPRLIAQVEEEEEEEDPLDAFMQQNEQHLAKGANPAAAAPMQVDGEDSEIDPLDAFMASSVLPEVERLQKGGGAEPAAAVAAVAAAPGKQAATNGVGPPAKRRRRPTRYDSDSSEYGGYNSDEAAGGGAASDDDEEWARKLRAGKLSKSDKLGVVDHTQIAYAPFRRNFYIEVPELARMTPAEVEAARRNLDGVKVRGKDVPKPVRNWNQCGLSSRVLEVLRKAGFEGPLPIQAQALPVIMSGRDCIGVAKTGSGKTLAFVLPMVRHVKDQRPLAEGDGPVALIMAPTRELVTQIGKEIRPFARAAGLECTAVYGGSGVANQISELKRGVEIVVCTPGRMIDVLATGSGKITNLRRVTYLVMDEADRMFDMGFEPQIMRMVNNIRPDRQTVMFSATFPRTVEALARQVLVNPVEIQVGGRSVVNRDITQWVEIRAEGDRFLRLLEILGEWYERGKLLIFVSSQDRCDSLFRDLLRAGYPCLSLHGGKDQSDRESTISDFKSNVCNVLVATSVAARGLDVRELVLVVNYDCPNHHEDYVHRVGRTGRAGNKGTAITFIAPDEEQYAPDLVKALKESAATVPADLAAMAAAFESKRKAGQARSHGSGYGGSGFKFNEAEDEMIRTLKKAAAKEFGIVEASDSEGEEEGEGAIREVTAKERKAEPEAAAGGEGGEVEGHLDISSLPPEVQARIKAAQAIAEKLGGGPLPPQPTAQPPQPAPAPPPWQMQPAGAQPVSAAMNPVLAAAQVAAQRLAMQMGAPGMGQQQQQQPPGMFSGGVPGSAPTIAAAAAAALQAMQGPGGLLLPGTAAVAGQSVTPQVAAAPKHYEAELEVNDFPQHARWKITHRDTIREIGETIGAAVVTKGRYCKPGTAPPEGERKLHLHIAGPTPDIVRKAKAEIKRILEESTEKAMRREAPAAGRYSIL